MKIQATRYHDFSAGHRVDGHEGKCANLHGHNYRVHFTVEANKEVNPTMEQIAQDLLDPLGRVIDFSAIKEKLCNWVEENWDHKFLIWNKDKNARWLLDNMPGIIPVVFNPTAENMAQFLVENIGPAVLFETGVVLTKVVLEETRKCSVTYEK